MVIGGLELDHVWDPSVVRPIGPGPIDLVMFVPGHCVGRRVRLDPELTLEADVEAGPHRVVAGLAGDDRRRLRTLVPHALRLDRVRHVTVLVDQGTRVVSVVRLTGILGKQIFFILSQIFSCYLNDQFPIFTNSDGGQSTLSSPLLNGNSILRPDQFGSRTTC